MSARGTRTLPRRLGPVLAVLAVASTTGASPRSARPCRSRRPSPKPSQQSRPLQAERLGVNRPSAELVGFRTKRMPLFDATVRGGTLVAPVNVHVATLKATETPGMPDVSLAFNHLGFCGFEMLPNHGALVGVQAALEPWDWGRRQAVALAEGAHPTVTGA